MKTQKFEWHGYLKLKKDRLYALQELGWQQNVIEECKSHLNECWSMEVDKIPADKALEHFSNITTRRIFFHPGVYKLTNNHYVPLHFTRNFELEANIEFEHRLNMNYEFEWYRAGLFPVIYHPETHGLIRGMSQYHQRAYFRV
uniref:Uncharacterized protein n=1 Tax=Dictyostelium citrinum TaxID=361072 RepID=B2VQ31_DICCI|nr:hypothetical protein [Dictyostelium citrinum]